MLAGRFQQSLKVGGGGSNMDYSAATWSATDKYDINLSNGNKTATASGINVWSMVRSNLAITGSIYVEVTTNDFGGTESINTAVGLKLNTDGHSNSNPVSGNGMAIAPSDLQTYTYGISFNPTTGAYAIRRNNTLVASGTLTPSANWRVCLWTGWYYIGAIGVGTINTGASAFTYTPVYL